MNIVRQILTLTELEKYFELSKSDHNISVSDFINLLDYTHNHICSPMGVNTEYKETLRKKIVDVKSAQNELTIEKCTLEYYINILDEPLYTYSDIGMLKKCLKEIYKNKSKYNPTLLGMYDILYNGTSITNDLKFNKKRMIMESELLKQSAFLILNQAKGFDSVRVENDIAINIYTKYFNTVNYDSIIGTYATKRKHQNQISVVVTKIKDMWE